ncbi:MAG TPA: lipid II flippase MurJ [Gammaproteobacteria bacterium]|nr:lipid II flippase MurJ [Gammaproteobacteria bacterium]
MSSSSRSFLTTNAIVGATLLVGFANNIAIAAIFGLTRKVDAFYAAQMLPNLFMVMCLDYLGKNFLPMLARAKKEGETSASELTSSVVTITALLALAVTLLLVLSSRVLFRILLPGFDAENIELVRRDFLIMAPAIVLMTITVFHQYVCQHDEDYVQLIAIRSVLPIANLAAIIVGSPIIGIYALPAGYLLGQALVFALMTRRAKYRYAWRMAMRKDWEVKIFSNSAIVMSSGLIARSRTIIINYVGSLLGGGAISALAMSSRLTQPLGRTAFMTVRLLMFSRTARLAVNRDSREIARLYDVGLSAGFLLLAPLLWWIALNSAVIVDVIFVRGRFDLRMAALVSLALLGAVPSVLFNDVNTLLSNAFYAMERVAVPALVMPFATLIYLVLAPALSRRFGVIGLTGGTSITAAVTFLVMVTLLARQLPQFSAKRTVGHLLRYALIGGGSLGVPAFALRFVSLPEISAALVSLVAGLLLYVLILYSIKDPVLSFVYRFARKAGPMREAASNAST